MSERAPSAPTESAPSTPEGVTAADIEADAQSMENAFDMAPEQADTARNADDLENALNPSVATTEQDLLKLTPEEQETKVRLEGVKELRIDIHEKAMPRINNLEAKMNTVRDKRDKVAKKALMLEHREKSKQKKTTRLGAKLERATPGSRRYNRLLRKYGKANRKLGEVRAHIGRLDGAADARANEHERKKSLREKQIALKRDMLKIDKKVAFAKKERRRLMKEMKNTSNESRRDHLKQEIARNNIGKLRQELLDEAMRRYKKIDLEGSGS